MKSLAEKEFSFNDLEKEIYRISCEYGSKLMTEILQTIDKDISNSRDKSEYRHKGIKKTTIKTLMGPVTYGRAVYETKTGTGEEASVFLLDKELKIDTYGKISSNLAAKIAECVSVSSYRETAEKVSSMTGQTISHGGVWNVVQELGRKLEEVEKNNASLAKRDEGKGTKETKILFQEADGVWISMQRKDRGKKRRKRELKMAVAYDGWEKESKGRYCLRNKVMVSGFDSSSKFQEKVEGAIAATFNTDEINIRILNGDGASWIKSALMDKDVHFQLDPFHKHQEITKKIKSKKQRAIVYELLKERKIDNLINYLKAISDIETDEKEQNKLVEIYKYFKNNKDGLVPYQDRGLKIPTPPEGVSYRNLGTMEHHVCDAAAKRMKHQKGSWSMAGATNMSKILCVKATSSLYDKISQLATTTLPERYTEKVEEILSAAKAPQTDGKNYHYPANGGVIFENGYLTNGRKAIRNMVKPRTYTELLYR